MQTEPRPMCNVCGSSQTHLITTLRSEIDNREYQVMECGTCGLVFAHPIPQLSFDDLQKVYNDEYTLEQRAISSDGAAEKALREATHKQMDIVEQYVSRGLALNVGAMNSAIGVLQDRGWRLKLIDVSRYAAESARQQWGFDVTVSRLEDFEGPPGTFDFIKLGHVLEHLVDPHLAMSKLMVLLKPGGVILIDTDNAHGLRTRLEGLVRRIFGETLSALLIRGLTHKNLRKRYGRLTPPEHLYSFSEQNLTRLVEEAGFGVVKIFKPAWGDPVWFPLPDKNKFGLLERFSIIIDQIGGRLGAGDVIAVLARKQ